MINNDKFSFEQVMKEGHKIILLRGIIDEDADFEAMTKLSGPLSFNFKGVTAINSCGVRSWVNFVKSVPDMDISYEECPPLIVRQMNMVPSFVAHAKVSSVYVPYVCDECDSETLSLVHQAEFNSVAETITCESCKKGEMEFDGRPDQYFAFAK